MRAAPQCFHHLLCLVFELESNHNPNSSRVWQDLSMPVCLSDETSLGERALGFSQQSAFPAWSRPEKGVGLGGFDQMS